MELTHSGDTVVVCKAVADKRRGETGDFGLITLQTEGVKGDDAGDGGLRVRMDIFRFLRSGLLRKSLMFSLFGMSVVTAGHTAGSLELPGKEKPGFKAAIQAFLDDNDAVAISELSKLANNGNVAAQLFLGRVDRLKSSSYLDTLNRTKRLDLMRPGKGKFRKSWLASLEDKLPLAKFFAQADNVKSYIAGGRGLAANNENASAATAFKRATYHGNWKEILDAAEDGLLPEEARYLAWGSALSVPGEPSAAKYLREFSQAANANDPMATFALSFAGGSYLVGLANKQIKNLEAYKSLLSGNLLNPQLENLKLRDAAEKWLLTSNLTSSISSLCRLHCPSDTGGCARAAYFSIGGFDGILSDSSPVEAIIPQSVYRRSFRAQRNIIRTAASRFVPKRPTNNRSTLFSKTSSCFGDLVLEGN